MNPRWIVALAVVLALAGGLGLYVALRPSPDAPPLDPGPTDPAPPRPELRPGDYRPELVAPDPVVAERPRPYTAPTAILRMIVTGRVATESGLAVPDARVRFVGEGALAGIHGTGFSDAGGRYQLVAWSSSLSRIPEGPRRARVAAWHADGRHGLTAAVELAGDTLAEMPDCVMADAAAVRGRVTDEAGNPAAGAIIHLQSTTPVEAVVEGRQTRIQHTYTSRTAAADSRGEYEFSGLRPGAYKLDVERGYFGQSSDSMQVQARPGAAEWADLQVKAANFLRGRLVDSDGRPVAGAVVRASTSEPMRFTGPDGTPMTAEPAEPRERFRQRGDRPIIRDPNAGARRGVSTMTDADGRFGFHHLQDAAWQVSAKLGDQHAIVEGARINTNDVLLSIAVDAWLAGMVRNAETGKPLEFFDVRLVQGGDSAPTPFERVQTDRAFPWRPGGEFRVVNPGAGDGLRVAAPGFAPASMAIAPLAPGERRRGIEIALQPLCDATLVLSHAGRPLGLQPLVLTFEGRLVTEASTDDLGRARLPALTPAAYRAVVFQADGTRLSGTVDVPPRGQATLELTLEPADQ